MAKTFVHYLGKGQYKIDGMSGIYDTSKTSKLLKDWKCPHCGLVILSYKDEMTKAEHFPVCKTLKSERKKVKKKLTTQQNKTLKHLGIIA